MALFRSSLSVIQRSKGQSSLQQIGYQNGMRLADERLGVIYDYSAKSDVLFTELVMTGGMTGEHELFWNMVECAHAKKNAVPARGLKLSLPKELSIHANQILMQSMARWLSEEYGVAVGSALHEPRYFTEREVERNPAQYWEFDCFGKMTNANWHAHLTLSACTASMEDGKFILGKKCDALDPIRCARLGLPNPSDVIREKWCVLINEALEFHGHDVRVDHRSNLARGIDSIPARHLGTSALAFERRTGYVSEKRKSDERRRMEIFENKRKKALEEENELNIKRLEADIRAAKKEIKILTEELLNFQRREHESMIRAVFESVSRVNTGKPENSITGGDSHIRSLSCETSEMNMDRTCIYEEDEEEEREIYIMRER